MPVSKTTRSLLTTLSVSVIALAACSPSSSAPSAKTAAPMPPITEMDTAMDQPAPQPLPLSQSDTLTPVLATNTAAGETTTVVTTTETNAPTFATGIAPANGSVEDRIARLEQSVGALREDYARIMPAFASLNTTNERISQLLDQIESETGKRPALPQETASAPVVAPTPKPVTAAAMAPATVPSATTTTTTVATTQTTTQPPVAVTASAEPAAGSGPDGAVTGVRIGEHGNKTRLVFDLSSKTKPDFKYDLDNSEKILLVEMPESGWQGATSGKSSVSPLVSGWTAQKGATGGSSVAVQLKADARVLSTEFLKAEGSDPARLVMDIAAGG